MSVVGQVAILDISMGFWAKTGIVFMFMVFNVAICNKVLEVRRDIKKEGLRPIVKETIKEELSGLGEEG